MSGDGDVMAFVTLDGVGIVDGPDFSIGIVDQDGLRAARDALLGAGFALGVRTLGAALVVADPSGAVVGIGKMKS